MSGQFLTMVTISPWILWEEILLKVRPSQDRRFGQLILEEIILSWDGIKKVSIIQPPLRTVLIVKGTPIKQSYTLTERPGVLRLYGNCYDLTSPETPAMFLRKQTSYNQTFKATMEFKPTVRGYEAGVVLWWSQYSYASIGVMASQNNNGEIEPKVIYKGATGKASEFEVSQQ